MILATIITYNPNGLLRDNILRLVNEVDEILIVDNASENIPTMENNKIKFIYNDINKGIATALNQALNYAIENNFKWLLTFDQDSLIDVGYVNSLIQLFDSLEDNCIGIVGPTYKIKGSKEIKVVNEGPHFVDSIITSGNLINIDLLKENNINFDDSFFIDYVDFELCFQLKKRGFKIIQDPSTFLYHELGDISKHKLLFKTIRSTNHSYIRRYYMTRNRLEIYKRYFHLVPKWCILDAMSCFKEIVYIVLFENNKKKKIYSVFRGIRDFIFRNSGPYVH